MRTHHDLLKKMHAEISHDMLRYLNNGQIWQDRRQYIFDIRDPNNGDQLKGIWTNYADEVFQLVVCGYVDRFGWQSYFDQNLPQPSLSGGGDIEAYAASRDPDQKRACMDGLRTIIGRLPRR